MDSNHPLMKRLFAPTSKRDWDKAAVYAIGCEPISIDPKGDYKIEEGIFKCVIPRAENPFFTGDQTDPFSVRIDVNIDIDAINCVQFFKFLPNDKKFEEAPRIIT